MGKFAWAHKWGKMTGAKVNNANIVYETKIEAIREIVECWDQNGFGLNNVNAKEQLVAM
jgi:hypothetical protein